MGSLFAPACYRDMDIANLVQGEPVLMHRVLPDQCQQVRHKLAADADIIVSSLTKFFHTFLSTLLCFT